jgi:hypothetical protein
MVDGGKFGMFILFGAPFGITATAIRLSDAKDKQEAE